MQDAFNYRPFAVISVVRIKSPSERIDGMSMVEILNVVRYILPYDIMNFYRRNIGNNFVDVSNFEMSLETFCTKGHFVVS